MISFLGLLVFTSEVKAADFALSFDGVDDYVDFGNASNLQLSSNFEVSIWAKLTGSQSTNIINRIDSGGAYNTYWYIGIAAGSQVGQFEAALGDGTNFSQVFSSVRIDDGEWHHVVWSRDGDTQTVTVDDVDRTETSFIDAGIGDVNATESKVYIGGDLESNDFFFKGLLDEVKIVVDGVTQGLWQLNEGQGAKAGDGSIFKHDGSLIGPTWSTDAIDTSPPPASSTGGASGSSGGPRAFLPEVSIQRPNKGDSFGKILEVDYEVSDENDDGSFIDEKTLFGLGENPVSIYYALSSDVSFFGETAIVREKTLIAESLPAAGSYKWNVENVPEGNQYHIVVEAIDNSKGLGLKVSERFSIDHTPPVFTVIADPAVSLGEPVNLLVESSESLSGAPKVLVSQRGHDSVEVPVSEEGNIFEGVYQVVEGFDGTALITVSGKDLAGNTGDVIVGGGTFNVGVEPPPKPIIITPLDKDVISTELIAVEGNVREDTEVILTVNGVDKYKTRPDEQGNFSFIGVAIDPEYNTGINFLNIISQDAAGNISEAAILSLKFNLNPELSLVFPQIDDVLEGEVTIIATAGDENNDSLIFDFEVSQDNGENWTVLAEGVESSEYSWDTTQFADGEYLLRVTVDDGFAKEQVVSETFTINNFLPILSFSQEVYGTNQNAIIIDGAVESLLRNRAPAVTTIERVEYSLDAGETWLRAEAKDGSFNTAREEFRVRLGALEERVYQILFRAEDDRGVTGRAERTLIVDFGPPPPPLVVSPEQGQVFSDFNDLDSNKAGIQIVVTGTAEPENNIIVVNGGAGFEGASDSQGNFEVIATLREHGENLFNVFSIDPAGNQSRQGAALTVVYNNPPDVDISWPRENGGLNHVAEIRFEVRDPDLDEVQSSSLSYRLAGSTNEIFLASNLQGSTFNWDVSNLPEGEYELILRADDGILQNSLVRKFVIDNSLPEISFEPLVESEFSQRFTLEMTGQASDNFSGVEFVEYSIDGENWFKAIITSGFRTRSATFRLRHPFQLEDGEYELRFRSTDVARNVSLFSDKQQIVVDTTPPRIGSFIIAQGSLLLFPEGEAFIIPNQSEVDFLISLEEDTESAVAHLGEQNIQLRKTTGLWSGEISLVGQGRLSLTVSAEDGFGNRIEKHELGFVDILNQGKVLASDDRQPVAEARIEVEVFDEERVEWLRWQAESYNLENPILSGDDGSYDLLLPVGRYQIFVRKSGFGRLKTSEFELLSPRFIRDQFLLESRSGIRGRLEDVIDFIRSKF